MNQLGMGAMLQMLCGDDESGPVLKAAVGKEIQELCLCDAGATKWGSWDGPALLVTFTDGARIALHDAGQSCCEWRYMTTDDDLLYYVGATFLDAGTKPGPDEADDECGECHDTAFLVVKTSKGEFTVVTHNKHNGYYGGFALQARRA